jgi:hypothetical protein
VVDHAAADMADHDAVLIAAYPAGDSLLVDDVVTDTCPVEDLAAEVRARIEDPLEAGAQLVVPARYNGAARVFDDEVI